VDSLDVLPQPGSLPLVCPTVTQAVTFHFKPDRAWPEEEEDTSLIEERSFYRFIFLIQDHHLALQCHWLAAAEGVRAKFRAF
jgi:hypothetical protein